MRTVLRCLALAALVATPVVGGAGPPVKLKVRYDEGAAEHQGKRLGPKDAVVTASSTLCEKGGQCHGPERLGDGKRETAWCEGAPGAGVGQKVVFELKRPRAITSITFLPFYAKNQRTFFDNARVKELELTTDQGRFLVEFPVEDAVSTGGGAQLDHSHPYVEFPTDPKVKRTITTRRVELLIKSVYTGVKHEDLCMSEVGVYAR